MLKHVIFTTQWVIGDSMNLQTRINFSNKLCDFTSVAFPPITQYPLIYYEIRIEDQETNPLNNLLMYKIIHFTYHYFKFWS